MEFDWYWGEESRLPVRRLCALESRLYSFPREGGSCGIQPNAVPWKAVPKRTFGSSPLGQEAGSERVGRRLRELGEGTEESSVSGNHGSGGGSDGLSGLAERAKRINAAVPQLTADVTLYSTARGGRKGAIAPGWGCPCVLSEQNPSVGYDGWPLLGEDWMAPGETRRLGFVFLSGERTADLLREAGRFFLWEGRVIGEATVVPT